MIDVRFRATPPSPTATWDAAVRLGEMMIERHGLSACRVTINANRQRVLSWRLGGAAPHVSVHWALVTHPQGVLDVIDRVPGAQDALWKHLPASPLPELAPRGIAHDLASVLAAQRAHLPEAPPLEITWGQWPRVPPRRSLRLGSCAPPLIRIHPVLDDVFVPDWFVGFVVFHEMLHAVYLPERSATGRRTVHTRAFRRAEAHHPDYGRALRWEKSHVGWLIDQVRRRVRAVR